MRRRSQNIHPLPPSYNGVEKTSLLLLILLFFGDEKGPLQHQPLQFCPTTRSPPNNGKFHKIAERDNILISKELVGTIK